MIDVGVEIQKVRKRLGFTKLSMSRAIYSSADWLSTQSVQRRIEGEEFVHYQRSNRDCLAVF